MKDRKMKRKSFRDKITYAYIRKIKKWMFCPACKKGKMSIDKKSTVWTCDDCGYKLSADEFENDYVFWFCDECQTYLNNQQGFDPNAVKHICINCGYENDTTFENVKGICSDCGKIIPDPDGTLCADCRQIRREKAKEWLINAGKAIGVAVAVAGAVCVAIAASDDEEMSTNGFATLQLDDTIDEPIKKCANCGNTDENTLWDEDDTIYCSKCYHRTSKTTGKDDVVECPYCHRMRDRKAMYCRHCNDSTWAASTPKEFAEIDKILKEFD